MMHVFVSRPRPWSRKESIFQPGYAFGRGGPHSIQSNQVGPPARPPARLHDSEVSLPPSIPFKLGRRRRPQIPSLPLPGPFKFGPSPIFISSFPQIARDGIRRQADSSPSSLEQGGRQAPAAVQRARLSTHLGSQPAIPFPPPASPAIHSQSQEDIDRAGQGRAGQVDNRHQLLLLQTIGRI